MFGFFSRLFAGPSPVIVACVLLLGLAAAVTVCWMLVRLVVDPRGGLRDDEGQHFLRAADITADESSFAFWWEDATG